MNDLHLQNEVMATIRFHLKTLAEMGLSLTHEFVVKQLADYVIAVAPHIVKSNDDLYLRALRASGEYITGLRQFIYNNEKYHDLQHLDRLSQEEWPLREEAIKILESHY